ncbi:MAG TPA: MBL fold metallo-hydrolase [Phycisphaerae bacterium]|jgi:glyoxylase-like metal-dependent hydrolase (beta-lactamase superfamily II)|nr:MBL fold metallo-hydrolase [Phycisphaerae bacterium]
MQIIAPGIFRFQFLWPYAFNAYYLEGDGEAVIVDASTRWDWYMMRSQLKGRAPTAVVLTHAHPDHQGCAAKICRHFNVPLWCHEADSDSAEGKARLVRQSAVWEAIGNLAWAGARGVVGRRLREGDRVAGFTVYHLPGHTRGSIALLRESDRAMIAGDVINSNDYLTGMMSLVREPPRVFSENPRQNREAIRRLWSLKPSLVCTGHGPPVRDMRRLERFVEKMT